MRVEVVALEVMTENGRKEGTKKKAGLSASLSVEEDQDQGTGSSLLGRLLISTSGTVALNLEFIAVMIRFAM